MTIIGNSALYQFGLLPEICIHTPKEDEYSKMYNPQKQCDCGCKEWIEEGCTMILGHYNDGTPMYKDVHRCKNCFKVRIATHIGAEKVDNTFKT